MEYIATYKVRSQDVVFGGVFYEESVEKKFSAESDYLARRIARKLIPSVKKGLKKPIARLERILMIRNIISE